MKLIHDKGYVMIYNPNHHRAKQNGYVYEHIVMAEIKLGRELKIGEEVHHEDRDKQNNHPDNLYVFATKSDHTRYHHSGIMIKVEDYYISPINIKEINCEICGEAFEYYPSAQTGKYCTKKCYDFSQRKIERPSKDDLFELIKIKSFLEIGRMYNVSDNSIRKWCKSYGLPYRKKDL